MDEILIIKPGTVVHLPYGEIHKAVVIAATISMNNMVRYNVAWWRDGQRHEAWVEQCEIEIGTAKWVPVGFATERSE